MPGKDLGRKTEIINRFVNQHLLENVVTAFLFLPWIALWQVGVSRYAR